MRVRGGLAIMIEWARVADYQKRSVVAVQQVPAILNSFATTRLYYRDL